MGKKGGLFSAIKRVFTPHSKEKLTNEHERKSGKKEKKKGFGIFREPSSIEKILGEAERDHHLVFRPPTPPDRSNPSSVSPPPPPPRPASPRVPAPRPISPRAASPTPRPRSFSPKPSAPPPRPNASSQVLSQRIAPPSVPSPRPTSPRIASPQVISQKPPSPRPVSPNVASSSSQVASQKPPSLRPTSPRVSSSPVISQKPPSLRPTSPRVVSLQAVSPKPHSPRADSLRLDTPRTPSPKPPPPREASPRPEQPRLDAPRPPSPREASPRAEPPSLVTPRPPSPRSEPPILDAPRPTTPKPPSPRAVQRRLTVSRPEPTCLVQYTSATKIQAAFRGHKARKSFRAMKGLIRLQGVVKGYGVKRQTISAMKYMQKLVRVQSHIQSRRIKTLESQSHHTEIDKSRLASCEAGNDNWDDSVLTKEERDVRSQRKVDAIIKRERSMAYAYSHKATQDISTSSGGLPLWWNWVDKQQLPQASPVPSHRLTPTRPSPSPLSQSRSTLFTPSRYSRGRLRRGQDSPFKDDDSLISCPPFPSYMAPTVSAKAKARRNSHPEERVITGSPSVSSETTTRRMSYPPMQQGVDMFRWNKGSLLMGNHKGSGSPGGVVLEKQKTLKSVGNLSVGSAVSMPSSLGRKAFNRYV